MDNTKSAIRNYWNWRSRSYGIDADKSETVANRWETVVNELVSDAPGKRALDVGTGTGQLAAYLARAGFSVTAVDLSERMISRAGHYAAQQGLAIDFRTGDAESLGFEDNAFDVVSSRNLLWTLPDPEKAVLEWRRVLKPDGRLIISDGLWQNTTWKRLHLLVFGLLKNRCGNGSLVSLRFFRAYAGLCKKLPYYEGVSLKSAVRLLEKARFRGIASYDISRFEVYPYGKKKNNGPPPFFIASAVR
jgi:ubiquinone/menaquinone biosynthesis C-methylase UbiE